jgi:hypothetical protein
MPAVLRPLLDPTADPRGARRLVLGAWALLSLASVAGALLRAPDGLRAAVSIVALDGQHVFVVQNDGRTAWQGARIVLDDRWLAETPRVEPGTAWRIIGGDLVDLEAAPLALVDPFYADLEGPDTASTRRPPPLDAPPGRASLTVAGRVARLEIPPPAPPSSDAVP